MLQQQKKRMPSCSYINGVSFLPSMIIDKMLSTTCSCSLSIQKKRQASICILQIEHAGLHFHSLSLLIAGLNDILCSKISAVTE
jgi:hypothetical protein